MAMRESVRSLRAYFILIGLSLMFGIGDAMTSGPSLAKASWKTVAEVVAGIVLVTVWLFFGIWLRALLVSSPYIILYFIVICAVSAGIHLIAVLLSTGISLHLFWPIVGLLINWYLYVNVRRLSVETRAASPADTENAI